MKTKILIIMLTLTSLFTFIPIHSYAQEWLWAKQIGGNGDDGGGLKIDANNNIYCSGNFTINCYFEHDTLNALGYNDIFFAKYDANNNEVFAKRIGGNNPFWTFENGGIAAIDNNNGCLYFGGNFYGMLTIDGHTITSSGGSDMFLAKFDLDGNYKWLIKAGGYLDDKPGPLLLDNNGNIYFAGRLGGNGIFDSINLSKGTFLSKIDTSGNVIWARNEISGGYISDIKIHNNKLVMSGIADNDTLTIDTTTLISNYPISGFILQTDLFGNCLKIKRLNSNSPNYATNFEIDSNNNFYLTGQFSDSITIDNITLFANGADDMFLCKFDSTFHIIWAKQCHSDGIYGASGNDVAIDDEGRLYLAGYFGGNASFGTFNVTSSSSKDMFLARYDNNGYCIGVRHFGEAESGKINFDSNGDIIMTGSFINSIDLGIVTLSSYGSTDMFFAKTSTITGMEQTKMHADNRLIIYANPNKGSFRLIIPDDFKNEQKLTLNIFDNTGKLMSQQSLNMNDEHPKINIYGEANGIYNVILTNGKKSYNGKMIVE
jgi:hypothetical protein